MKKSALVLVLSAMVVFAGCHKDVKEEDDEPVIKELENYPRVDGSTSTAPLNTLIACKLLGIDYEWVQNSSIGTWGIEPKLNNSSKKMFGERIKTS